MTSTLLQCSLLMTQARQRWSQDVPTDLRDLESSFLPTTNFDFFSIFILSAHFVPSSQGERTTKRHFRGRAPDAAMSSKERSQSIPSSSGRRERKSRAEMTPQRPESKRSGRSSSKEFVRGGGDITSLASPLRTPQPTRAPVDKLYVRVPRSASSVGSAKSAASRKFKRDDTLNGYIERLRDVEALCDLATSRTTQAGLSLPAPLEEFRKRKDEVLRCVNDMKDLPGSQQILGGKVSDEMFRELRYTGKRLDEYNQIPIDPLTSMLGSAGVLAGWGLLASEGEKNPATLRLEQLRETCESLQTIEEILTSQMSVLNWTLDDAVTPPVEQAIITPKSTAKDRSGAAFADEDSTCCWCCSSAPIPEPTPEKREKNKGSV